MQYIIGEYDVLIDNIGTRDYVISWARNVLGWVFDGEVVYRSETQSPASTSVPES